MEQRNSKFTLELYIKNLDISLKEQIEDYIKKERKEIIQTKCSILLEGYKLSPEILEPK